MLDATGNSTGSGLDEASALRAQLAALSERFKELEAKQASQPPPAEVASAAAVTANSPDDDLAPALAEQSVETVDPMANPSTPTPEETAVPPVAENLAVRTSDGNFIHGLEDVDGVLTQSDGRSPSPDVDVDQEEDDLVDLDDDPEVDGYAHSENSDRVEYEEREEDELEILEAEDQPAGGSSTPNHQDLDPSDSEDESVFSVSDDSGADRMERMLKAAQENQRMPPPSPRTPRDPRILASAARAAAGCNTETPKSRSEKNLPPVSAASSHPSSSRATTSSDVARRSPEPRAQTQATGVVSEPVVPSPGLPSLDTGDGVPRDPEPEVQEQVSGAGSGTDRSSLFFIPEKFKGLIRIEPTSSRMVQDEREWRLAEDHLLSVATNGKGEKEWRFLKGFESEGVFYSLVLPYESLEEKWVSGKRLVALQPSAREIPAAERAFASLKTPPLPSIYEAEARKLRKRRILMFADVESQNCASAMGWSGISEDQSGVVVKELPIEIREVLEGSRPARAVSPPVSFSLEGPKDSPSEGFHKAAYGDLGKSLNDYLE